MVLLQKLFYNLNLLLCVALINKKFDFLKWLYKQKAEEEIKISPAIAPRTMSNILGKCITLSCGFNKINSCLWCNWCFFACWRTIWNGKSCIFCNISGVKGSSMSKNYLIAHLLLNLVKLVNKLEVNNSDIVVESFTMVVLVNSLLIEGYKL